MRIGWAFTGAGHLLNESVQVFQQLAKDNEVTVFLSSASEEVLKMYGLYENVKHLTGGRYREFATDSNQRFSFPITGRFSLGKYDLLIVSPATANTVSKIVYGISDTVLPSKLELSKCEKCDPCTAALTCPNDAIIPYKEISLLKCLGCGLCKDSCPHDAISVGKVIQMHMRDIDIENTKKLREIEGINVIEHPSKIIPFIEENIN